MAVCQKLGQGMVGRPATYPHLFTLAAGQVLCHAPLQLTAAGQRTPSRLFLHSVTRFNGIQRSCFPAKLNLLPFSLGSQLLYHSVYPAARRKPLCPQWPPVTTVPAMSREDPKDQLPTRVFRISPHPPLALHSL